MLTPVQTLVLLGCVGGALPDILRVIKGRHSLRFPKYLSKPTFWVGLAFLMALGGFASWFLGAQHAKEAMAYGFAAPELVSRVLSKSAEVVDRGDVPFFVREWWAA